MDSSQAPNGFSVGIVSGWFNTGSGGSIERWGHGFQGISTADGSSFIEPDVNPGGGLDYLQTNIELDTSVEYTLTFDAAARASGGANDYFEVTHNGVDVVTISPSTTTTFSSYDKRYS